MDIYSEKKGDVLFVRFDREFSIRNIRDVDILWEHAKEDRTRVAAFDFQTLEFIDSSAIGTLVKYLNEGNSCNIKIVILNTNSSILKIFNTAKLSRLFKIMNNDEFNNQYLVNLRGHGVTN